MALIAHYLKRQGVLAAIEEQDMLPAAASDMTR